MNDFYGQCLDKEVETRPEAAQLLQHPFMQQATPPEDFAQVVFQARQAAAAASPEPY